MNISLRDIPIEVLLDNLLPQLALPELAKLARCDKFFLAVCNDDTFWKRKVQSEFNFAVENTARSTGWKIIYRGLHKPRVYTWGRNENGRLGHSKPPASKIGACVPFPAELRFPGHKIVSLVSGGWSFHALDSDGNVYAWGTLNGLIGLALNADGFSRSEKKAQTPHKLILPARIRSISSGRMHAAALDTDSHLWTFTNWGRPFRLITPLLDTHVDDPLSNTPVQVECGWHYTAVLTASGSVFVSFPLGGTLFRKVDEKMSAMDEEGGKKAQANDDGTIPCCPWDFEVGVSDGILQKLPPIPELPPLLHGETTEETVVVDGRTGTTKRSNNEPTKLVKLAGMSAVLVGLTNKGHVLTFGFLAEEEDVANGSWKYLPKFSETGEIRNLEPFSGSSDQENLTLPDDVRMTHISAQHNTFVVYSLSPSSRASNGAGSATSSLVLMGKEQDEGRNETAPPLIIPHLQNRSIISVVLGDYHCGALTSDGRVLTWGGFSMGALGLGDPLDLPIGAPGAFSTEEIKARAARFSHIGPGIEPARVDVPAEVTFNRRGQRVDGKEPGRKFCFALAAAGWHMGALVIDLEPGADGDNIQDDEDEDDDTLPGGNLTRPRFENTPGSQMPGGGLGTALPSEAPTPGGLLGGMRGVFPFRIGFAGRGAARGGARGRGLGMGLQPPPPGGYPDN